MVKILITGANGQLGNEIKHYASRLNQFSFVFTDVQELDITNKTSVFDFFTNHQFNWIVNCAAYTAVDKAEEDKLNADKINADAVKILNEAANEYNCKFIHISTDYVFDGTNHIPYKEEDTPNPISIYGLSKLKGEQFVNIKENGMIIRTSWLYSSYGNNFVKTILRLGKEKSELNMIFDQVGCPTYGGDLANAILEIITSCNAGESLFQPGIFHYANEGVSSWYDFAWEISNLAGLSCRINPIETQQYPLPAKRPAYSVMNKNKIKSVYGLYIPHWKDGLTRCIKKLNLV